MLGKHLLGLKDLAAEDIMKILDLAEDMKKHLIKNTKKLNDLKGKSIITLFYENSTRTRTSFELAGKLLSADVVNMSMATSSVNKGENLLDTVKTLNSMKFNAIIVRHAMGGVPQFIANNVNASVINAGDGVDEHPTQALLDMLTIYEKFGTLSNLKVAIIGDIKHSRVAKSNLFGFLKFNSEVRFYSPKTLKMVGAEKMGAKVCKTKEEALKDADIVMGLRIQLERQKGGLFPSLLEYNQIYGVNEEDLKYAKKNCLVMHPGPVNRGVELDTEVIDGKNSVILEQVTNGVAVRMAVLKLLTEEK